MEGCLQGGDYDQFIAMQDAMIRFFFKEDPDTLDDSEYARRFRELTWLGGEGFLTGAKQGQKNGF